MFLRFRKRTDAASLQEGAVAVVEGTVEAEKTLMSPGSNKPCVFYDVLVEGFGTGKGGRGRGLWNIERMEQKMLGFFVADGSGKVWISDEADILEVDGGRDEAGVAPNRPNVRYKCRTIAEGDVIRVRGVVSKARKYEPKGFLVIRPFEDRRIEMLVRKLAPAED